MRTNTIFVVLAIVLMGWVVLPAQAGLDSVFSVFPSMDKNSTNTTYSIRIFDRETNEDIPWEGNILRPVEGQAVRIQVIPKDSGVRNRRFKFDWCADGCIDKATVWCEFETQKEVSDDRGWFATAGPFINSEGDVPLRIRVTVKDGDRTDIGILVFKFSPDFLAKDTENNEIINVRPRSQKEVEAAAVADAAVVFEVTRYAGAENTEENLNKLKSAIEQLQSQTCQAFEVSSRNDEVAAAKIDELGTAINYLSSEVTALRGWQGHFVGKRLLVSPNDQEAQEAQITPVISEKEFNWVLDVGYPSSSIQTWDENPKDFKEWEGQRGPKINFSEATVGICHIQIFDISGNPGPWVTLDLTGPGVYKYIQNKKEEVR